MDWCLLYQDITWTNVDLLGIRLQKNICQDISLEVFFIVIIKNVIEILVYKMTITFPRDQSVDPYELKQENQVNNLAADFLHPSIARPLAATVLAMQDKWFFVFCVDGFELHSPSLWQEIINS